MYSKAFEKVFDAKPKPKIEKFPLENGVTKTVNNEFGITDFSKEEDIDGLKYDFHLKKRKGDKSWNLGFGTEHGQMITNKGLVVYKHIIENIVALTEVARKNEKINKISFFGAEEDLRVNEVDEFKNFLKSKTENNTSVLDNFSYVKDGGTWKESIHIRNGLVRIEDSGKRHPSLRERLIKEDVSWNRSDTFSIENFLKDQYELARILNDKEILSSLLKHIGADFSLSRNTETKDVAKMRANLYERTLKQKFADYKFERKGNTIVLSL